LMFGLRREHTIR